MENKKKIVLAFSGGLDTSFCAVYLREELGFEVHAFMVNTGGFDRDEISRFETHASQLGVQSFECVDARQDFYDKVVKYLVFGNVLKNGTYPLSVSAERTIQAMEVAKYARQIGASTVAHGSTGAGNDQVRFDLVFRIVAPELSVITPIRDLKLTREAETDHLKSRNIQMNFEKAKYSINKGLWGTTIGGVETLSSRHEIPESAYPTAMTASGSKEISLEFFRGECVGINGEKFNSSVDCIEALQIIASPFAIGRDIHVGDTIIGIKGRVGFEAAAPIIILKSHHLLEKHTLSKWQLYWKQQLAEWYANGIHEGQYFDPTMRNIECFFESTQEYATGTVFVRLHPYRFELLGIESPHDLLSSKFGTYGEMNTAWTGDDVKGFTKVVSNATRIFYDVNGKDTSE